MKNWKSSLFLFISIFALYAIYMWFVKENHDPSRLLLESLVFSAALTGISTAMDALRAKFIR